VKIYEDGVQLTNIVAWWNSISYSQSQLVNTIQGTNVSFGSIANCCFLDGSLDDIRIYNRALSVSEIQALYLEGNLNDGLVAYYPFNGNANDESRNGHNETGNTATLTEDRFGNLNCAYHFDGYQEIIVPHSEELNIVGDMTLSAWFNSEGPPEFRTAHTIITKRSTEVIADFPYLFSINYQYEIPTDYKKPIFVSGSGGTLQYLQSNNDVSNNIWNYIACVISGNNLKIFLNSDLVLNTIIDNQLRAVNTFPFLIGSGGRTDKPAEQFVGKLDDIRIYNRALSESEIQALFNEGNQPGPSGSITGPDEFCAESMGLVYSVPVIVNASYYSWTLPSEMTIITGDSTNVITVDADSTAFTGYITVQGINEYGSGDVSSPFEVTSVFIPPQHGPITGNKDVCAGASGEIYSIDPVPYADSYTWTVPPGATIVSGENTNEITVNFSASVGVISVYASNVCGNSPGVPALNVKVWPIPTPPVITYDLNRNRLTSNHGHGNQWFLDGTVIPGATGKHYTPVQSGIYTDVVTEHDCSSGPSNEIYVDITLKSEPSLLISDNDKATKFIVYPNPGTGIINYKITLPEEENLAIKIFNSDGVRVYKQDNIRVTGLYEGSINLKSLNDGVYIICLQGVNTNLTRSVVIRD
jgi:hypothetical protein